MQSVFVFTSESVTRGHPDKLCDQISDAIVGRYLRQDRFARVIAECATSSGLVFLSLRLLTDSVVDATEVTRSVIANVGYDHPRFNPRSASVVTSMIEFRKGVARPLDEELLDDAQLDQVFVGDQATVFGYACTQTEVLMPMPIYLANRVVRQLDETRSAGTLAYLSPDGKVQVGIEYRDNRPTRVHSITLVTGQRDPSEPSAKQLEQDIREQILAPVFAGREVVPDAQTRIAINPEGPLRYGGPPMHAGLTGRKSGCDSYGEFSRQGGSALSGKDPSRIDRVGAYAARHAAKNVVAAGLCDQCEVQLSYSLGLPHPVSTHVDTFGTGRLPDEEIARRVLLVFDFRIGAIVRDLQLRRLPARDPGGFYRKLAAYGHFGREDLDLPWERSDRIEALRNA